MSDVERSVRDRSDIAFDRGDPLGDRSDVAPQSFSTSVDAKNARITDNVQRSKMRSRTIGGYTALNTLSWRKELPRKRQIGNIILCSDQDEGDSSRSFVFVHSAEDRRLNLSKVI
jgi:hypothetical protein